MIRDLISGKSAGNAANAILQPKGQNSNQQPVKQDGTLVKMMKQEARTNKITSPVGLWSLINLKYGSNGPDDLTSLSQKVGLVFSSA